MTGLRLYTPPNGWFIGAAILGAVLLLLSMVGVVATLSA
jgi:hypothetical protein